MVPDYSILKVPDLRDYCSRIGYLPMVQNPNNGSVIFQLKNDEVALFPALSTKGLLFKSLDDYNRIIINDIIPLQVKGNRIALNQEKVERILKRDYELIEELKTEKTFSLFDFESYNFEKLELLIKKYGKEKFHDKYLLNLIFYLGEFVINKYSGRWTFRYQYQINRYKKPLILRNGDNIDIAYAAFTYYIGKTKLNNCLNYLNLDNINYYVEDL